MIKIKWGLVSGAAAFALAFLNSLLLGHTSFAIALLRAVIFAAVFFGLGIGIRALIANFIPDLLFPGKGGDDAANNVFSGAVGSRVNITVDDAPEPALPEQNEGEPESVEVGSFNDLLSGSIKKVARAESAHSGAQYIDQNFENDYTEDQTEESAPVFGKTKFDDIGDFSMDFGAFVSGGTGGDVTGGEEAEDSDLDSFSFFPGLGDSGSSQDIPEPERKASGNKPMKLEGDFDPKEIAAGIRTVLNKEKG
jgi:hypothetical protein